MLSAEGISQADIARRFGVTRQRVAALLAEEADPSELPIA
jgi:transcriptional regulator with XRE-family HTH domain